MPEENEQKEEIHKKCQTIWYYYIHIPKQITWSLYKTIKDIIHLLSELIYYLIKYTVVFDWILRKI